MASVGNAGAAEQVKAEHFKGETVGSIVKLCSASEDTDAGKYAIGFCYGWIEGLDQFYDALLADERFDVQPIACPGTEASRDNTRAAFVSWAEADPTRMNMPALEGMIGAVKEAYPCN